MDSQLMGENKILWPRVIGAVFVAALIVAAIWFVAFRSSDSDKKTAKPASSTSSGSQSGSSHEQHTASPASPSQKPSSDKPSGSTPSGGNNAPASTPSASAPSTATSSRSATTQPTQAAQNGARLANTGPGDALKVFAASSMLAGAGHYALMRYRRRVRA